MNILRFLSYAITILGIILIWWFYPPMVKWLSGVFHKPMDESVDRLGALFSALAFAGLFITIYLQRKDFVDTRKYTNLNEFIELYQYFSSAEFRAARVNGWATIKRSLLNDDYGNFMIGQTLMNRYVETLQDHEIFQRFQGKVWGLEEINDAKTFCELDSAARHKLDDVINFYQLLSIKHTASKYFDTSDFFYDSWRPLLYWYAFKSLDLYNADPINKKHNNPPGLLSALKRLDENFFCPEDNCESEITRNNINNHIIIQGIRQGAERARLRLEAIRSAEHSGSSE